MIDQPGKEKNRKETNNVQYPLCAECCAVFSHRRGLWGWYSCLHFTSGKADAQWGLICPGLSGVGANIRTLSPTPESMHYGAMLKALKASCSDREHQVVNSRRIGITFLLLLLFTHLAHNKSLFISGSLNGEGQNCEFTFNFLPENRIYAVLCSATLKEMCYLRMGGPELRVRYL